jgi:hypothetical protein
MSAQRTTLRSAFSDFARFVLTAYWASSYDKDSLAHGTESSVRALYVRYLADKSYEPER